MAESFSERRHVNSFRDRLRRGVQEFFIFVTLWSSNRPASVFKRERCQYYKVKRGLVFYGNKWIPLQKFRHVQVCFRSPPLRLSILLCTVYMLAITLFLPFSFFLFICLGTGLPLHLDKTCTGISCRWCVGYGNRGSQFFSVAHLSRILFKFYHYVWHRSLIGCLGCQP